MSRTHAMTAAADGLATAADLEAVQAIVRRTARRLAGADGATFVIKEGEQCVYVDEDAIAPLWKGQRFPLTACISGWAMLNQAAAAIEDIYADPRVPQDAYRSTFVKSLAMLPIRQTDPLGAIGVYWAQPHLASAGELELLQMLADSTGQAMERLGSKRALRLKPRGGPAQRCHNLYAFIKQRLGPGVSDREISRQWGIPWKSFANLKQGARRVPRLEDLERLAQVLEVDPIVLLLVAGGEPAHVVSQWLSQGDDGLRAAVGARLNSGGGRTENDPLHLAIERIPWAVFTTDIKGRLAKHNGGLVSLFAGAGDLSAARLSDLVSAESGAVLLQLQSLCLQQGESGPVEVMLENGAMALMGMVRIDGRDGKPLGFQCTAQNPVKGAPSR